MPRFDLCVVGSGPGGQKAAIQAAKLGKRVCVVEQGHMLGGSAVHTGTIPSKAMREMVLRIGGIRSVAPLVQDFAQAASKIGLRDLRGPYEEVVREEAEIVREHFESNDVRLVTGRARFRDAHNVDVVTGDESYPVEADFFVIAVGSTPACPASVPFDGRNVFTTDDLLQLGGMPHSMIIVGGGVIGTEYASMLAVMGVRVTLIEGRSRLLEFADAEIVEALQYHLRQNGVTLRLGEKVASIERVDSTAPGRNPEARPVEAVLESGKRVRADCLLYCIGRQGATADLGLAALGIEPDARGRIEVDSAYRTSVPHVYAVGDVIGFPALASTSMEQGRLAACHMFEAACDSTIGLLPYGIYSIPEISMVGATEEQLTEQGIPYEGGIAHYREIARGKLLHDEIGMLKLLIHTGSHALLGVHAIGTGATELVHIGQAVMALGGKVEYFVDSVFNYPTLAECYKVAALNGLNRMRNV